MTTEINTNGGGGGNALLAFVLGGVLVFVGIIGFFMWDHYKSGGGPKPAAAIVTVKK